MQAAPELSDSACLGLICVLYLCSKQYMTAEVKVQVTGGKTVGQTSKCKCRNMLSMNEFATQDNVVGMTCSTG